MMNAPSQPSGIFPFAAIVGQEEMKLALLLNVVDPQIGGLLVMGHRGTAKSTAVRALAAMMPEIEVIAGCPYNAPPDAPCGLCPSCTEKDPRTATIPVPVVDLPLGSTEDRVTGTLDLEKALVRGERSFEPGLLARANRGFLYIDEVNLLEDHLVDLLLDVSAAGINIVERETISIRHPARFVLIGSGNPEEGELRPQLLDRFGLSVKVVTEPSLERRVEIIQRRLDFDRGAPGFAEKFSSETAALTRRIVEAQGRLSAISISDELVETIAALAQTLELDGHRGEMTLVRAAMANAAFEGREKVEPSDIRPVAPFALTHRLRRNPLETRGHRHRLDEAVREMLTD